jgi:hypothetical protein
MIDVFWTPGGLAAAARYGVSTLEAVEAVDSPRSVQVHVGEDRIMFLGGIRSAIVVTLDRQYRNVTRYGITDVRPATDGEARAWEKRNL